MKEVIIAVLFWTRDTVQTEYKDYIVVFGDNDVQRGKKGQAIIRGMPNAFGIPTKKFPSYSERAFYTDEEYEQNCAKIMVAIEAITKALPH
jgi:hypothetical protein